MVLEPDSLAGFPALPATSCEAPDKDRSVAQFPSLYNGDDNNHVLLMGWW